MNIHQRDTAHYAIARILLLGMLLAPLALAGCEEPGGAPKATETKKVTVQDVGQDMQRAAETSQQFLQQKKEEYVDTMNKQIKELDQSIETLKEKGNELSADTREKWNKTLADLEAKRRQYQKKYDELTEARDDVWQDLKSGIEAAWKDLKQATDDAAKQLHDQSSKQPPSETARRESVQKKASTVY